MRFFGLFLVAGFVYCDLKSLTELAAVDPATAFEQWQTMFQKKYDKQEYNEKFKIFESNARYITKHNNKEGGSTFTLALNEFADMSEEEFRATRLGYDASKSPMKKIKPTPFTYQNIIDIPKQIDWREKDCVSGVKNQGSCGSCWAFSTTGSVEGINCIKTGELESLSEQELVDCDGFDDGCSGGLMDDAYQFIIDNKGIDTEKDYGYWSYFGFDTFCNHRKEDDRHAVTIQGYSNVPAKNETALAVAASQQPISVAVCVDSNFQYYHSGVLDGKCCENLDHGVLVVGYVDEGPEAPYWIVKNSWGSGWGENGYLRMRKNIGGAGQCGIALNASYPIKTEPNPTKIPQICDFFSIVECQAGFKCTCDFDVLDLVCVYYSCVADDTELIGCDPQNEFVCPKGYDVCDANDGVCTDSSTGEKIKWIPRVQKTTYVNRNPSVVAE